MLDKRERNRNELLGTSGALKLALGGFSNSAVALVAAAMQATNLHKRLALYVLSLVGTKTKAIVFGAILVSIILAFFVPSATARAGAVVPIDTTTVTIIAILLAPKVGVYTWNEVEKLIPWGTVIVFAVGIALGILLLNTQGAQWLSDAVFGSLGLDSMPILATIVLVTAFNILIHLGFASATSLASALIPVFIALATTITLDVDQIGFVLLQQFVISFGFLLPISAPQNMLAYGTGAFTTRDFLKSDIPLTIIGYLLVLLFSATYWKWIGLL